MSEGSRQQILAAIRHALRTLGRAAPSSVPALSERTPSTSLAELFAEQLTKVGGNFSVARNRRELRDYLAEVIASRGIRVGAVSDAPNLGRLDLPGSIAPHLERLVPVPPPDFPGRHAKLKADLAQAQLGVTTCRYALAETGTLLVAAGDETNRLLSLLPTFHVAIFTPEQLVADLSEALRRLRGSEPLSRAITLITGPSRTGDIELTLTVGVHGPRELHAILYQEPTPA